MNLRDDTDGNGDRYGEGGDGDGAGITSDWDQQPLHSTTLHAHVGGGSSTGSGIQVLVL